MKKLLGIVVLGLLVSCSETNPNKSKKIEKCADYEYLKRDWDEEASKEKLSKVTLKKDAHLKGDLKAAIITLEEGARFDGMCSMVKQEKYKSANSNPSSLNTANEQV